MAVDSFTEVTEQSFISKIMESIRGILVGVIIFISSFLFLWKVESCSASRKEALVELKNKTIVGNSHEPNSAFVGKPVHLVAPLYSKEYTVDSQFLKPQPLLKLVRKVEMLQWQQTKSSKQTTNLGGSTTTTTEYNYNKEWSASRIDSQHFKESAKYSNPNFVIASSEFTPNEITFDVYNGKNIISRIAAEKQIQITNEQLSPAVDTFMSQNGFLSKRINGNYIYFYRGSTQTEDLGDIRVSFTGVSSAYYSVIASPTATNDLRPYVTANNENFFLVEKGNLKIPQMIQGEEKRESTKTWILRLIGLLMMWFGSYLVFRPISLFFEILPILGTIVGQSIGIITGAVSLILAASTILVAKVFHNPVYLMIICGIVTICCFRIFRRKKNESFNASSTFNNFHRNIQ